MKNKHVETKIEDYISEVLNSKANVRWENNGVDKVGFFELGDSEYKIEIDFIDINEYELPINEKDIKTFVFKFFFLANHAG